MLCIKKTNKRIINNIYFLLASIFLLLQFYTSFELGLFGILIGNVAILLFLLPKQSRDIIVDFFKSYYDFIIFYILVIILMLLPMAYHFVCFGEINTLNDILAKIPKFEIWIRNLSILDNIFYKKMIYVGYENAYISSVSLGIFTLLIGLIGLFKLKYYKGSLISLVLIIFAVSSTNVAVAFWRVFYLLVIGIESIETLNALAFILLIIISYGVSLFIEKIKNNKIIFLIILILIFEQVSYTEDLNSSYKSFYISKKQFNSQIYELLNQIKTNNNIIQIDFEMINSSNYAKSDVEYKNRLAQKIVNIEALWLGIFRPCYIINDYKKNNYINDKAYKLQRIVDYNKI